MEIHRVLLTRRLTGGFLLLLAASTWRLWVPHEHIPAVPVFASLAKLPAAVDWILLAAVITSCAVWTVGDRYAKLAARRLLASLAMLMALDQLRWQPWAIQGWLFIAVLTLATPQVGRRLLRWLLIGIYFHSAVAKLDYEFTHTLGQQLLGTLSHFGGMELDHVPANLRFALTLVFPAVELLAAGLLCFRRTARVGVVVAVVINATTIALLGPWGLDHQWGVLVWNLWLAIQMAVLFWPDARLQQPAECYDPNWKQAGNMVAASLVAVAIALPFTTRFGWWDTWPSWGLYAPGAERATVWVNELALVRLPPTVQQYARGEDSWRQFRLDRWVLAELRAPLYPQNRVRLALANALAERYQIGDLIRVQLESPAARFSGERERLDLENQRDFATQLENYWLNASATR